MENFILYLIGDGNAFSQRFKYAPKPRTAGSNFWLHSGDMIRIRYLDVNSNAQHEEAGQLMSKHCGGSYIETSRVNKEGWTIVEAECIHDTDS
jgi:hypothetical protein